jgi:rRNA-processing protein FCF1
MATERELRKLLEKIEIKYLHKHKIRQGEKPCGSHSSAPILFKLTASQKYTQPTTFISLLIFRYVEICTELVNTCDTFDFNDLDSAFNLIVKPASMALDYLNSKKDPDALDVFFIKTIELFQVGVSKAEQVNQIDHAHKARLMCIDVHKLRLLALDAVDQDALDFALNYLNDILYRFPSDGRFWFQHSIINFSFIPQNTTKISNFSSLNSLFYALLARQNPVEVTSVVLLLDRRVTIDFSNTLLTLALHDFKDFTEKDLQTWSFVKYFQSFIASNSEHFISHQELTSILLFIFAFFRVSRNSFHLRIFFESFLSAKNQAISEFWPFAVYLLLQLIKFDETFELSDAVWFKIFQLLKKEYIRNSSLISSFNFKTLLNGTYLNDLDTDTDTDTDLGSYSYDFDEEFSIERDSIISCIVEHFELEPFNKFITLRKDGTLRLGYHFCETESDNDAHLDIATATIPITNDNTILDNSIEELRNKLATLSPSAVPAIEPLDYLNNHFIIDTNVILSGSQAIRTELSQNPERFLIPLMVLSEISKLCDSSSDKSAYAKDAWEFLQPLLVNLKVYNNYGRLLRTQEITQQLAIMSLTRKLAVNDDQIIELANQFNKNFLKLHKPVIITEDINMRLKAKSKSIRSISIKEFRNLCNC